MTMSTLNVLANGTAANATPVDANFDTIAAYVDTDLVNRDGTIAMTGDLTLAQAPTSDLHASTKKYVDDTVATVVMPAGIVSPYAGAAAPTGFLLCDGSAVSQASYADLYTAIGTTYGDPGGGQFNLPDLRSRVPVGKSTDTLFDALGETGGSTDSTLVSHTHPVSGTVDIDHGHSDTFGTGNQSASHTHVITHGHADTIATTGAGNHGHQVRGADEQTAAGGFGEANIADWSETSFTDLKATSSVDDHTHGITGGVTNFTGSSGNQSASHNHAITGSVTALNQANEALVGGLASSATTPSGGSATDTNVQPYITLNYIIKT